MVIGLSGGVDSALVLAIAVDALGADAVRAVMMPYRYTSDMSMEDAQQQAGWLDVEYDVLPIKDMVEASTGTPQPSMKPAKADSSPRRRGSPFRPESG